MGIKRLDVRTFTRVITSLYLENPCRVLPNALWKTLAQATLPEAVCLAYASAERIEQMALRVGNSVPCWVPIGDVTYTPMLDAAMVIIHARHAHAINISKAVITPYFRLTHSLDDLSMPVLPHGFHFRTAQPYGEAALISDVIGRCYADLHPNEATVRSWTTHSVYDQDLWLWIETADQHPVALGIVELDTSIGEASLEWIQVLPAYRGGGLGRALVRALLCRTSSKVQFATVAGRTDAPGVEAFYRACGFTGDDQWWVVRRH